MKWNDLARIGEAPASGTVLVYTRKHIELRNYTDVEQVKNDLADEEILELHLFNEDKEYRCISTESRRFEKKIESVSEFLENPGLDKNYTVFQETTQLENKYTREVGAPAITALNKVSYDEHGLGYVSDYRLKIWRPNK